ncbi:arylamine N-acetyltransferase family protein [Marinoscillum sp.]|uniref:arylamine N-acetyltransferase family protein n=1 Tax=Marinoscillum sp. TaxID=2024838 RepID=UPI003BA9AD62
MHRSPRQPEAIDAEAYLARIGTKHQQASVKSLRNLHYAHLLSVPYENLDFHYRKKIVLSVKNLFEKVVHRCRGGIAYELNILFYHLLAQLGYSVSLHSARIYKNEDLSSEFEHVVCLVQVGTEQYLCDVGFGDHFCFPKIIRANHSQLDYTRYYKLEKDIDNNWILKVSNDNSYYQSVYQFNEQQKEFIEFIPRCNYHQDNTESPYHQEKFITQLFKEGRIKLTSRKLSIHLMGEKEEKEILNEDAFLANLEHHFGIRTRELLRQSLD